MSRRIVFRPDVPVDLHDIVRYLDDRNRDAADRFIECMFEAFDDLALMPGKGSPKRFRERRLADVRSWSVPHFRNYLILYQYTDDAVIILAVLHGARDLRAILRERTLPQR